MYKINEYLVYGKDVCKVYDITEENNITYYLLRPLKDQSLKIKVPTNNQKTRNLISKEQVNNLIFKMKDIKTIDVDEKYIEAEYKKLLQEPTHEDLISIIKTTYLRNKERLDNNKKLTEKDTKYFELAEQYLYNEFSIVLNLTYSETKDYIINEVTKLEN